MTNRLTSLLLGLALILAMAGAPAWAADAAAGKAVYTSKCQVCHMAPMEAAIKTSPRL